MFRYNIDTPLGEMVAVANEEYLLLLKFIDTPNLDENIEKLFGNQLVTEESNVISQTREELTRYFNGALTNFTIPMSFTGTDFYQQCWEGLATIPYGQTVSYKQQAIKLGKPTGFRAVAQANSRNNITILVPCHRVIGSNGKLTGYACGLDRKQYLLDLEAKNSA